MKKVIGVGVLGSLLSLLGTACASGFGLLEESVPLMGTEYAGAAAKADDASTEYYNAAQIVTVDQPTMSVGGVVLPLKTEVDGGTWHDGLGEHAIHHLSGKSINFIPNAHFVTPMSSDLFFAFGLTVPFGLRNQYDVDQYVSPADPTWLLVPTSTSIKTVNFNPSFAYAVDDHWSVALGFDAMRGEAVYDAELATTPNFPISNDLSGWGYGYNAGILYRISDMSRLGFGYRSPINLHAKGPSVYRDQSSGQELGRSEADAILSLPDSYQASFFQELSGRWDVVGTAALTRWSRLKDLVINRGQPVVDTPTVSNLNYKDAWFFSLGADYRLTSDWQMKAGVAYDRTPTQYGYRDLRLPGADRYAASVGARWSLSQAIVMDLAYQHLFIPKAHVDDSQRSAAGSMGFVTGGVAKMSANLFGVSVSMHW